MPFFIEMRCADQDADYATGKADERCWSHDNAGCGRFGGETLAGAITCARSVINALRKSGWVHIKKHGWVCPHCAAQRERRAVAGEAVEMECPNCKGEGGIEDAAGGMLFVCNVCDGSGQVFSSKGAVSDSEGHK